MQRNKIIRQIDWSLIFLYLILVVLGWLNIYSAGYSEAHPNLFDFSQEYGKQFMWIGVCIVIALIILSIEGRVFVKMATPIYLFVLGLLMFVLVFGVKINGATAWFRIGSLGVQPSEFTKFSLSLIIAKYLQNITIKSRVFRFSSFIHEITTAPIRFLQFIGTGGSSVTLEGYVASIVPILLMAIPAFLIMLQPDTGTVLVYSAFVLVLYREGISGNILLFGLLSVVLSVTTLMISHTTVSLFSIMEVSGTVFLILFLIAVAILFFWAIQKMVAKRDRKPITILLIFALASSISLVSAVGFIFENVMQQHQKDRIEVLLGLREDKRGVGYNVNQSMAAIGSGGITGKGYKNGTLSNQRNKHVPMQTTDFIYCSIGEEWGLIGGFTVIGLFMLFLSRIIIVAERQRSNFTRIYGYCVASIIFFHFAINIAMTIGLAPVIGIPLPFFSYGGSSIMGFTILLFILIRLDSERKDVLN